MIWMPLLFLLTVLTKIHWVLLIIGEQVILGLVLEIKDIRKSSRGYTLGVIANKCDKKKEFGER